MGKDEYGTIVDMQSLHDRVKRLEAHKEHIRWDTTLKLNALLKHLGLVIEQENWVVKKKITKQGGPNG